MKKLLRNKSLHLFGDVGKAKRALLLTFSLLLSIQISAFAAMQEQRVNLDYTNATLGSVLKSIGEQVSLSVVYNNNDINTSQKVTIKAKNEKLESVLSQLFKGSNVNYSIQSKHIVLSLKKERQITSTQKEKINAYGNIKNSNGEPLIGVSILVKGTSSGTNTDVDGNFKLNVSEGDVLRISYVGYSTQNYTVTNSKAISIVMEENTRALEEVVVTALGIKRQQKALSYNVQEIKSKELTSAKDPNFVNSLTGKIAGVTINSSASGIGGATRVVMRGPKSINGNNNALFVIDGVPLINTNNGSSTGEYSMQPRGEGISDINPEDIESMSVLTGAAAAALYGSSAANGAILITTKSGKEGKARITIASNVDFMRPFVMPRFQNTYGNKTGAYGSWGDKLEKASPYEASNFFNTGTNVQNSVSLSVGNSKNQTYLSVATTNSAGIIPNNSYNRYNFTFRNTTKFLNDKMTLDAGASYILQDDQNMMAQGKYFNPLVPIYTFPRGDNFDAVRLYERYDEGRNIKVQSWPYGDQGLNMQNPYWITERNLYGNKKTRYMLNANLKYSIFDWMSIAGRVRVDNSVNEYTKKYYASTIGLFAGPKGFYLKQQDNDRQIYADAIINVNKTFGDFNLSGNFGTSVSHNKVYSFGVQGPLKDIPNFFSVNNIDLQGRDGRCFDKIGDSNVMTPSVFGNVELGWRSMLYLTLTGRNDWSSTLVDMPQRSFFYPSIGLSGLISQMVKLPEAISYLKVRGSWASVGSAIPPYLSIPTYKKDESTGKWNTTTYMPIDKLYPERTNSWEFGLSSKFWNNSLSLDVTLYKSNTTKQTFNMPISATSGYSSWYVQTGDVENRGLEVALGASNTFGELKWNSNIVFSHNQNKIIRLFDSNLIAPDGKPVKVDQIGKGGIGSSEIILKEGGTIGDLYTKTAIKKDQEGNIWVDPATGNISIEENVIHKAGSVLPKFNLGFGNDFSYKKFEFGFMFSGRFGGVVISPTQAVLDGFGVTKETADARDNGGIPVNNGTVDAQKWYETIGSGGVLSHYVYSATNIRLQEVRLGYTFPTSWFKNAMTVNVSFVGRNLLMIYNKAPFDPELTASTGTYFQGIDYFMQPSTRKLGFSVKFQF